MTRHNMSVIRDSVLGGFGIWAVNWYAAGIGGGPLRLLCQLALAGAGSLYMREVTKT